MKTIWKYVLEDLGSQTFGIPSGATILCAKEQHNVICIWAELDPANSQEERTFDVIGTGHALSDDKGIRRYLGTAMLDGGRFVFHVYERSEK